MFGPKELVVVVIVIVILAPIYFLPSIVATKHPHRGAIFVLDLFLGWTFVGWVAALCWSLVRPRGTSSHLSLWKGCRSVLWTPRRKSRSAECWFLMSGR